MQFLSIFPYILSAFIDNNNLYLIMRNKFFCCQLWAKLKNSYEAKPETIRAALTYEFLASSNELFYTWTRDMVMWCCSADALFWQFQLTMKCISIIIVTKANVKPRSITWTTGE